MKEKVNLTVLSQVVHELPKRRFKRLVEQHGSDRYSKKLDSWCHLISMLFCQFANCGGIRDINVGLRSRQGDLNHIGMEHVPTRSSLSYLNATRSWELFRDFFHEVLEAVRPAFRNQRIPELRVQKKTYALDSTLISLCLDLFDWAHYQKQKGACKLHTLLDYEGFLPVYAEVTDGKTSDIEVARKLDLPAGTVLVVDRAYIDFEWLADLDSKGVVFVTRTKKNLDHEPVSYFDDYLDDEEYILEDVDIELLGQQGAKKYPKRLRKVTIEDPETGEELEFLTNERKWKPSTVALLYKKRWEVETFFKFLKQNLRIKSFVGTTFNAVMIQLWTALTVSLLIKFLQKKAEHDWNLSNLVHFLRLHMFTKMDLWGWLNSPFVKRKRSDPGALTLFDGI